MTTCVPLPGSAFRYVGECRDEGLALAGAHFGDLALVQHHAADQLHVEVPEPKRAARGLTHDGESLGQDVVERLAGGELLRGSNAVLAARSSSDSACSAGSNALMDLTIPVY